jgi:preprotein translocase subunit SecY
MKMRGKETFASKSFYGMCCVFIGQMFASIFDLDVSPYVYAQLAVLCFFGSWFTKAP